MPVLQIRMLDDLYAWIKANGGSPFARRILEQARRADGGSPAQAEPQPPPASGAEPPPADGGSDPEEQCPRWMHHRKGQFCKTCGKTP